MNRRDFRKIAAGLIQLNPKCCSVIPLWERCLQLGAGMLIEAWQPTQTPRPAPVASLVSALIARAAPYASASPAGRATLARGARRTQLRVGDSVFRVGESPRGFKFVSRGIVKLVRSRSGRSAIPELFGPGEALGVVFALRDTPYPVDAIVLTPTAEIVEIPRLEVLDVAAREPAFALALAESCAERAVRMLDAYSILAAGGTEARLAALLIDLSERFGDVDEDDLLRVPVALSRAELAACICTTTETVIRLMSRWAREDFVHTLPEGFVIRDVERLRALAEPLHLRARRAT